MQVERDLRSSLLHWSESGGRVSNAWVTWPMEGDSLGKPGLIPYVVEISHDISMKDLSP